MSNEISLEGQWLSYLRETKVPLSGVPPFLDSIEQNFSFSYSKPKAAVAATGEEK